MWCAPRSVRWDFKVVTLLGALGVERSRREVEQELLDAFAPWNCKNLLDKRVTVDAAGRRLFLTTELGRNETKDVKGWRGDTALHLCIRNGCSSVVIAKLLCSGADATLRNDHGESPRDVAAGLDMTQIIRLLDEDSVRPLKDARPSSSRTAVKPPRVARPATARPARPVQSLVEAREMATALADDETKECEKLRRQVQDWKSATERARSDRAASREAVENAKQALNIARHERDTAVAKAAKFEGLNKHLEDKLKKLADLKIADRRALAAELGGLVSQKKMASSGARVKRIHDLTEALLFRDHQARYSADLSDDILLRGSGGLAGLLDDEEEEAEEEPVAVEVRLAEVQALESKLAQLTVEERQLEDRLRSMEEVTNDGTWMSVVAGVQSRLMEIKRSRDDVVTKLVASAKTASDPAVDDVLDAIAAKSRDVLKNDGARGLTQVCKKLGEKIIPAVRVVDSWQALRRAREVKATFDRELADIREHAKDARFLVEPLKTVGAVLRGETDVVVGVLECDTIRAMEKVALGLSKSSVLKPTVIDAKILRGGGSLFSSYADVIVRVVCEDVPCRVDINLKALADLRHRISPPSRELLHTTGLISPTGKFIASVNDDDFPVSLRRLLISGGATDCFISQQNDDSSHAIEGLVRVIRHPTCFLAKLTLYGVRLPPLSEIFAPLPGHQGGSPLRIEDLRLEKCRFDEASSLPRSIALLGETLVTLEILDTPLTGTLPADMAKLKLRTLRIQGTGLRGEVPPELAKLASSLEHLELPRNRLSGTIPAKLASLVANKLQVLDLSENELTGVIPADLFVKKGVLHTVKLHGNQLYGPIPPDLCAVRTLTFHDNFYDYYEIMLGRGLPEEKVLSPRKRKEKQVPEIPLDSTTATASSQCRGNYGPEMALGETSYYCTTFGDRYGNPDDITWSCRVPRGYVPRSLELHFVVDKRDPTRRFLPPTVVEAEIASLTFRRAPTETGDDVLRLVVPPTAAPTVTKDATLRIRMRRSNASLGHYLGLRRVLLFGDLLT